MDKESPLITLIVSLAPMSLMTVGGGLSVMGDIQRMVVNNGWFTPSGFVEIFAISRVAPGPGALIVTLIGWHVSGFLGAIVASVAIFLPSSLLTYTVARIWHSRSPAVWQKAVAAGLAPIAAGLILSSIVFILRDANAQLAAWLAAGSTAVLSFKTRLGPLGLLGAGAAIFVFLQEIALRSF